MKSALAELGFRACRFIRSRIYRVRRSGFRFYRFRLGFIGFEGLGSRGSEAARQD